MVATTTNNSTTMSASGASKSQAKQKKSSFIPLYLKIIFSCAICLFVIQVSLLSAVYFHLNEQVENAVLSALLHENAESDDMVSSFFKPKQEQEKQKAANNESFVYQELNSTERRRLYKALHESTLQEKIDLESMLKIAMDVVELDSETKAKVPHVNDIKDMYGTNVILEGLDTCKEYRDKVPLKRRMIAPAGLFNTGTHLLWQLLKNNCIFPRRQVRFQVPWGKHNPVDWKYKTVAAIDGAGVSHDDTLPIVIIKDPINWIDSMCKHPYGAQWRHSPDHCPNLVPNEKDKGNYIDNVVHASVKYNKTHRIPHWSLLHIWMDNYQDWLNTKHFPRIMVRYEDLLFQPLVVVKQVCDCAGGNYRGNRAFYLLDDNAKGEHGPHAGGSGLVKALSKYGSKDFRKGVVKDPLDYDYARRVLNEEGFDLMATFRYNMPE